MQRIRVLIILLLASFLLFYRLSTLMMFIGDQGWFYLSARDMVLTGHIPLVGITSSQVWLHQGPIWTYLLAIILWLFHFQPAAPAYFTAFLGLISVGGMYWMGREMFSEKVGLLAALVYATSPLVIVSARMPYHTSPIPLLVMLFLSALYKWISGNVRFFPLVLLSLTLLYNFELATVMLWFILVAVIVYGLVKKTVWIKKIWRAKILVLSILALVVPMLPILIYDVHHRFLQTIKFAHWLIYLRIIKPLITFQHQGPLFSYEMLSFLWTSCQRLLFLPNGAVALLILCASFIFFLWRLYSHFSQRKTQLSSLLLFTTFLVPFFGLVFSKTPSDAYLPILYPSTILICALFFDFSLQFRTVQVFVALFLVILVCGNVWSLLSQNYLLGKDMPYGPSLKEREEVARHIIQVAGNHPYNLKSVGKGSEYESSTMHYEYLLWYYGHPPSHTKTTLTIFINDEKGGEVSPKKE